MANGEKQVEHDAEALANALECDHPDITELLSAVKASARAAQQSQHVTQRTLLRVAQNRLADENVGTAVAWLALASPTAASADSTAEQLCVLAGKSAVQLHKPALHATRREQAIGQLFMHGTSMQLLPLDTQRQLAQRLVHLISQVSDDYDRAAAFLAVCNILLARANKLHDDTRSVVSCEITKLGLEHLRLHAFPFWAIPNAASALLRLTASAADDTTALSELLLRMALSDVEQTRAIACTSLQCASNPLHTAKPLVHALDSLDCTSAARFRHQHAFRLAAAVASAVSACSADGCVEELDARGDTYVLLQHAGLPANALPKRNLSDLDKLIQDARAAVHELPNAQSKPLERVHIGILAATSVFRTFSSSTSITASIGDVAALAGRTASHSLKFLTSDAADDVKYELQCVFADAMELLSLCVTDLPAGPLKEGIRLAREAIESGFICGLCPGLRLLSASPDAAEDVKAFNLPELNETNLVIIAAARNCISPHLAAELQSSDGIPCHLLCSRLGDDCMDLQKCFDSLSNSWETSLPIQSAIG